MSIVDQRNELIELLEEQKEASSIYDSSTDFDISDYRDSEQSTWSLQEKKVPAEYSANHKLTLNFPQPGTIIVHLRKPILSKFNRVKQNFFVRKFQAILYSKPCACFSSFLIPSAQMIFF